LASTQPNPANIISIGVDLAGFPPHDGQTAVIKSGSKMVNAGALL